MSFSKSLLILFAAPALASAVQITAEPFQTGGDAGAGEYVAGVSNLIGQNATVAGFSGGWLPAYNGAQSPDVIDGGLAYPALTTTGGSVRYTGGGNGRCGRRLVAPYDDTTSGPLYLSVLIQLESASDGYAAFELHQGGFDDGGNRTFQIAAGEPSGGAVPGGEFGLRINNDDAFGASLGALDAEVNLFVIRIDFSADPAGDRVTVYRNPSDLAVEGNNVATAVLSGFDFRFDRASFARFNANSGIVFDELRIGTEFDDVTGSVDPDEDDDGMDDGWEFTNMVDDPEGDALLDNDGLTNLEEFLAGTDPNDADTDDDGVDDLAELNGSGNAFDGTPTDPVIADVDGDRLNDGEESSAANGFVTNPKVADTDGDGEDDKIEIDNGTDPLDPESNSAAAGEFVIDGARDELYGDALAVQTVETGFGNNLGEMNAGYGRVADGKLYLLMTGNIEANFNKLEVFIDATPAGANMFESAGNDGSEAMDGLVFDAGFTPEFHLIVRRGEDKFDLDFADLRVGQYAFYERVFGNAVEGAATTGAPAASTFTGAAPVMRVAYDDSNTAGIGSSAGAAADQAAALTVTTGLELCIELSDLGWGGGDIRVCLIQNNGTHDFASNQFLGGMPVGTDNVGSLSGVDLGNFEGDQFFTVPAPEIPIAITQITVDPDTRQVAITFSSVPGRRYIIENSANLEGWGDIEDDLEAEGAMSTFEFEEVDPLPPVQAYRVRAAE